MILKSARHEEFNRFGTYKEIMQATSQSHLEKYSKKIVEATIRKIMDKENMTLDEIAAIRKIICRMKQIGQQSIMHVQPLVIIGIS